MRRQKLSDEHTVDSFLQGYKNEIVHMLTRRLRLLGPSESNSVRRESNLGKLRMLLELKRDGRKKAVHATTTTHLRCFMLSKDPSFVGNAVKMCHGCAQIQ